MADQSTPKYSVVDYIQDELRAGFNVVGNLDVLNLICEQPELLDVAKILVNLNNNNSAVISNVFLYAARNSNCILLEYLIASDVHVNQSQFEDAWIHVIAKASCTMIKLLLIYNHRTNYVVRTPRCGYRWNHPIEKDDLIRSILRTNIVDPMFDEARNAIATTKSGILNMDTITITMIMAGYDDVGDNSPLNILHVTHIIPMVADIILYENL